MAFPLKIRAHHLLCLQGFQGFGYNDAFVDHLQEIVTKLKNHPDLLIEVVTTCDTVCSGCPHCREAECRQDEGTEHQMEMLDLAVLKKTGLEANQTATAEWFFTKINTTFSTRAQRAMLCGDCQWSPVCTWYLGSCS